MSKGKQNSNTTHNTISNYDVLWVAFQSMLECISIEQHKKSL